MTYQELLVEHEAGIVTVALNRPDVRNVISDDPLMTELTELCAVLDATALIHTGDLLLVDGDLGVVRVLERGMP